MIKISVSKYNLLSGIKNGIIFNKIVLRGIWEIKEKNILENVIYVNKAC